MGSAENKCQDCRFFVESEEGVGDCVIVAGEVAASGGCKQWDEAPGKAPEDGDETPSDGDDPPTDNPDEGDDPVPDEDGNCPEGYEPNEDGTKCVMVEGTPEPAKLTLKKIRERAMPKSKVIREENPEPTTNAAIEELDRQIEKVKNQISKYSVIMPGKGANRLQTELEDLRIELKRLENLKKKSMRQT